MKIIAAFFLFIFVAAGCANEKKSKETLKSAGYSNIIITGWSPFKCGEDDTYSTGFRAKNPTGTTVSGVVCCGLVTKGCTIRF